MLAAGAVEEVAALLARELDPSLPLMKAIGVREIGDWLAGRLSRDETIERAVIATRQYAKRQRTWFRSRMADWDGARGERQLERFPLGRRLQRQPEPVAQGEADGEHDCRRRKPRRESDPDADAAQAHREAEQIRDGKADRPIADERDEQRHLGVGQPAQRRRPSSPACRRRAGTAPATTR